MSSWSRLSLNGHVEISRDVLAQHPGLGRAAGELFSVSVLLRAPVGFSGFRHWLSLALEIRQLEASEVWSLNIEEQTLNPHKGPAKAGVRRKSLISSPSDQLTVTVLAAFACLH